MIDEARIAALVDLALPLSEASRVALLDGLTHLPLTEGAWHRVAPLAHTLRLSEDEQTFDVLARVPLLTVRNALRSRAATEADALGRGIALALAQQHDPNGVQRLMAEFTRDPGVDVARALACVLEAGQGVSAEDLQAGLASADEMVRLWTVIAIARVLRRDGAGPDFGPLDRLWDAFAQRPGSAAPEALFDGPPGIFHGDPAWAASQIAVVRPWPAAAVQHLLGLKDRDFDGWLPRQPETTQDSSALRALVAGLTGLVHADGEPLAADEAAPPGPAPSSPTAPDFKPALEALVARAAADPAMPDWVLGNQVLDLAWQVSPEAPFAIGPLLDDAPLLQAVPRTALAWALARNGPAHVLDEFTVLLGSRPAPQRTAPIEWLRDIALEFGAAPPYQGSGGEAAAPAPPPELIDDRPWSAAKPSMEPTGPVLYPGAGFPHERAFRDFDLEGAETFDGLLGAPAEGTAAVPGEPPPGPEFHFVLEGDDALGDAMRAGGRATLEFRFQLPPPDALAVVEHESLDEARKVGRDILLELTAYGSLLLPGARQGVARFAQQALVAPVPFELRAGQPDEQGSGVHVEFIVRGETVYQLDLPIAVLPDASALRQRAQTRRDGPRIGLELLDAAAGAATPPPQRVRLALALDALGLRIDLTHWVGDESHTHGPFVAPDIDRARLETLVASLRADLANCYKSPLWTGFDGEVPAGAAGNLARAELPRTCSAVAAAGARLNDALRLDAPAIAQALDHIEHQLPEGSTLTIATDAVYLPWEILYPRPWMADFTPEQREQYPLDTALFWGARFAIETVQLRNTTQVVELRRKHLSLPPRVSVNLNPKIVVDGLPDDQQPLAVQNNWAHALQADGRLETVQQDCKAMRRVLQNADTGAGLVYVYCHGTAARPFGGSSELLDLASGCSITPLHLAGDTPFGGAPIVFLNACESAAHSPLAFSSFLQAFRRRGALGMIAASFAVPIVFGAHFGAAVSQCVLARQGSLAVALLRLRRRHLLDLGNPIPLFYALQCQITYP